MNIFTLLILANVGLCINNLELSHDIIIFRDPPGQIRGGYDLYVQVGSLRLAQKINSKVGSVILKGRGPDETKAIIQKAFELISGGGKILFKRGAYYLRDGITIPRPSYFVIEGEQYRFSSAYLVSHGNPPILFETVSDEKPTFLQLRNLVFKVYNPTSKFLFKIPKNTIVIFEGININLYPSSPTISGLYIEADDEPLMKIIEYYEVPKGVGVLYDLKANFVTGICPEGYNSEICCTKFGPGGLLIGGHHGFGAKPLSVPAVSTYKLNSEEFRKSYPSTVIGLGYECGWTKVGYRADGAYLILVNASITGRTKLYEEVNGGKVIAIGVK